MLSKIGLPMLALAMLTFAVYHVVRAQHTPPELQPPVQPARSPFGKGVAGSGIVEARKENIAVGTHLPGIVTEVFVKVGDKVNKGTRLFRLDDRALLAEKQVRLAMVQAAEAQLTKLRKMPREEEIPALEARVREARAVLVERQDQLGRMRRLYASRAVNEEDKIKIEQAMSVAREQVSRAEADLALMKKGAWEPDLKIAEAQVMQSKAQLAQTETELTRLVVDALDEGEVLQVNVRPGEYVLSPASTPLIVLGDTRRLRVRVDIDEHDIPRLEQKNKARATLRGDPSKGFDLSFVRLEPYVVPKKSLTGDNTERVDTRVLQVIYELEPATIGSPRVFVGQQVDVYIDGEPSKTTAQ
jgi:multidrug resistance efflux pump